jgi:hypothetical protein
MNDLGELLVARTFSYPAEAELARTVLTAAGIESSIRNENLIRIDWFLSNAVGGVKLMVRRSDLEQASELLASDAELTPGEVEEGDGERCPRCGGSSAMAHPLWGGRWVVPVLLTFAVPAWLQVRRRRCDTCDYTWKPGS